MKTAPDQPLGAPIRWSQALVFLRNNVARSFLETVWKTTVSVSEMLRHEKGRLVVPRGGIEPPTHGFSVRCSTN
jgi:hypothetical protein